MSRDITKIFRQPGQVTLGSDALGFTRSGAGSCTIFPIIGKIPLTSEERGITKIGMIHGGYDVKAVVELLQWDATTLKHLFPNLTSGTTATIDPDTTVPGTRLDQTTGYKYTFEFLSDIATPNRLKITAPVVVASISPDQPIRLGLSQDNYMVLDIDFVFNEATHLWKIEYV